MGKLYLVLAGRVETVSSPPPHPPTRVSAVPGAEGAGDRAGSRPTGHSQV